MTKRITRAQFLDAIYEEDPCREAIRYLHNQIQNKRSLERIVTECDDYQWLDFAVNALEIAGLITIPQRKDYFHLAWGDEPRFINPLKQKLLELLGIR